jgi:peptidoglycan/xylan/chitin deacetylase (PgdA/CDA1 family)
MLGKLYYGTLHTAGITTLARRLRQGALVLCYHNVVPRPDHLPPFGEPGLHLPVDRFTAQVHWLKDHYTVVSLRELVDRLENGRPVRGLAAITFDDGYAGAFTFAWPLLRALDLPATMFIVGRAPDRPAVFWWDHPVVLNGTPPDDRDHRLFALSGDRAVILRDARAGAVADGPVPSTHLPADWSVVAQGAAAGLDLGAHTMTHRTLTQLGETDLAHEIARSRDVIEERTGWRPRFFAYPYGIWDGRVHQAVRRAGYRGAVTLEYGLNTAGIDTCMLRRVNVPAFISSPAFAGWAAGIRPRSSAHSPNPRLESLEIPSPQTSVGR